MWFALSSYERREILDAMRSGVPRRTSEDDNDNGRGMLPPDAEVSEGGTVHLVSSTELKGSLKLGNVWVFVQLKGDPLLEQFSLQELYHMLELLDRIEADRSVDLTTTESKTFKYLLDSYVGRK